MKNIFRHLLSLTASLLTITALQLEAQTRYPGQDPIYIAMLPQGMPLYLESRKEFSTKYQNEGDNLIFHVKFPITIEGEVIIRKGTEAVCRINRLEKAGGGGKAGFMEIQPLYLRMGGDQIIALTGEPSPHGGRDRQAASIAYTQVTSNGSQAMMELHNYRENQRYEMQNMAMNAYPPPMYAQGYGSAANTLAMGKSGNVGLMKVAQAVYVVGPLVGLLIKGKQAVLPAGYVMNAYIAWDTAVEIN